MGDEAAYDKNSKHEDEPACSLYVSRATNSHPQGLPDELSKGDLEEAIRESEPSGSWNVSQTSCGLIVTFSLEADAEKLVQRGNLSRVFQGSIQVARFSARDSRYRQSVFLRDVPWAIPLEDLSSALVKQGINISAIERCRQYVRVEVLDASQYEHLLRQGLDFFGAARFSALPERISWWRPSANGINGPHQLAIIPGNATEGSNPQQPDGVLQCYRCQGFWHVAANCRHLPRCVRCGEPHSVEFCSRPRNNPICCHCSGPHHAGFRQCPVRLQLLNATPISITLSTSRSAHDYALKSNLSQGQHAATPNHQP
ncbi:uncharacterized protein LOC130667506 [Microplitis mediator]|uniref:uncharacterized protein LOC130667506 n=1 Tax=Microplitis mediator TaxID=375433 RepID=UPI002553B245|nr:uncharacterized protein LOC130667506 [Microplitis mediator]